MAQRYDTATMDRAQTTPEGWLRDDPVLSRSGIFTYTRSDGTVVKEYRPPEEVFHADSLASVLGVPVTVEHPPLMKADTEAEVVGASISQGRQDGENLRGSIIIHRPQKLGSRKEISLGYTVELDQTPGEVNGERYDAVQRKIRINHIAIVSKGRAGNARLRLDSCGDQIIEPETREDAAMETVSIRVDDIEYKVPPQVAKHLTKLEAARDSEKARADKAEGERDSFKSDAEKAKADVEAARKDAADKARERVALETKAKSLGATFKADASDREVREAVIKKVRGDSFSLDGKSDDYVVAAYDMAVGDAARGDSNARGQSAAVNGGEQPKGRADSAASGPISAAEARRRMIAGIGKTGTK